MNRQDFNQMMKDSFGGKVVNIPSKTDNELIAEFMEVDGFLSLSQMEYHQSWNWLMPVVEKISDIKGWSLNSTLEWLSESQDRDGFYDRDGIFQSVVEFINQLNK